MVKAYKYLHFFVLTNRYKDIISYAGNNISTQSAMQKRTYWNTWLCSWVRTHSLI